MGVRFDVDVRYNVLDVVGQGARARGAEAAKDRRPMLDNVAAMIAEQRPDLTIDRMVTESAELFMNFLVGNGFIILGDSGDSAQNIYAQEKLQTHYPDRNVHFVDVSGLWDNGGGIHCVTNDQPLL